MSVPVSDYVAMNLSIASAGLQVPELSTAMLMGHHTAYVDRVREYNSLPGLVADGFSATGPIYRMAQALLSQPVSPSSFKVGRRANAPVMAVDVTMLTDVVGNNITITVTSSNTGNTRTYSQACGGGGLGAEATALAILINADAAGDGAGGTTEILVAAAGNDVTFRPGAAAVAGQIFYYSGLRNLDIADVTPDPGLNADIVAIRAEDDDWYGCAIESPSLAEQTELALRIEAMTKFAWHSSQDSTIREGTAGNLAIVLNAATYQRSMVQYSPHSMAQYPGIAAMSGMITRNPGATTLAYQSLSGVTAAGANAWDLTAAQLANCRTARANVQVVVGGLNLVDGQAGWCSATRWVDERLLLDWLELNIPAELVSAIATAVAGGSKIPYTDAAANVARGAILKVLGQAAGWGAVVLLDEETGVDHFTFSHIKAANQLAADRAARNFAGVTFGCLITGATQTYELSGVLSFES